MIKVVGIVNGTPDFRGHGKVINGTSDLLVEVLGDRGRHARTCTGSGRCVPLGFYGPPAMTAFA